MQYIILLGVLISTTILLGIYFYNKKQITKGKKKLIIFLTINAVIFTALILSSAFLYGDVAFASETGAPQPESNPSNSSGFGFLAAALSTGLATIGAGYAVGSVGSSALGAVSENPKLLGKTLIFVGLAEGIAIYGLIISILILGRL